MPRIAAEYPTLVPSAVPAAGVQAVAAAASSARTHQVRPASASRATAALTSGWPAQAMTSQALAQSPLAYARRRQSILPRAASSSSAGVTAGEISSTSAPAASSRGTRRAATAPPADHQHLPAAQPQAEQVGLPLSVLSSCHGGRVPRAGARLVRGRPARASC